MKTKVPQASAVVSRQINILARHRKEAVALARRSKAAAARIISAGSCRNEQWNAYVRHHEERVCSYLKTARDSVRLTRRKGGK